MTRSILTIFEAVRLMPSKVAKSFSKVAQPRCTSTHRHHHDSIELPCSSLAVSTIDPVLSPTVHSAILLGALPTVLPGGRLTTSFESITYSDRPVKRQRFRHFHHA